MISLRICVTLRTFVAFFTIEYEYHMQWLLSKGLRHNATPFLRRRRSVGRVAMLPLLRSRLSGKGKCRLAM